MMKQYLCLFSMLALIGCPKEEICDNDIDDDGNGQADCNDSACIAAANCGAQCGDAVVDVGEQCDGTNLNGQSCTSLGQDSGTLACNASCLFDASGCVQNVVCGDGIIDVGEDCDGNNVGGESCGSLGQGSGVLACDNQCLFDTSG